MPAAYERCLRHVRGKVRNEHAVCTAANAGNVKEYRRRHPKSSKYRPHGVMGRKVGR